MFNAKGLRLTIFHILGGQTAWLVSLSMIMASSIQSPAVWAATEPIAALATTVDDVVVGSTRIRLDEQPAQVIDVQRKTEATQPTLESALRGQSNIQITPTPLKGSNLSLEGFSGEQVAIWRDGDPILGRVDGALDARAISIEGIDRIAVYHGLDSLPYGSQNIGGVIALESPWRSDAARPGERPAFKVKSAGGDYGRTLVAGEAQGETAHDLSYFAGASNWRSNAIIAPSGANTLLDAYARASATVSATQQEAFHVSGNPVDARLGASGYLQNTNGIFSGAPTTGDMQRVHVFGDFKQGLSDLHASYSQFGSDSTGVLTNTFRERAFRADPNVQSRVGNTTFLAGAIVDAHSTESTRIASGREDTVQAGGHLGLREALGDHVVLGAGTRWDQGPGLFSPRGEIRYLSQTGTIDHVTMLEVGRGFRDPTPKERFNAFVNPALHYSVVGNPNLTTETATMGAFRHIVSGPRFSAQASVFVVRTTNAIGTSGVTGSPGVYTYANLGDQITKGAQTSGNVRFWKDWQASAGYQYLWGQNLATGSQLFLQPRNRVSLSLGHDVMRGWSILGETVWTSPQGFFDVNRNNIIDAEDLAPAYWMANIEAGYGFRWSGVSNLIRVFGRVDNALDVVHADSMPIEPRTFQVGAAVEL